MECSKVEMAGPLKGPSSPHRNGCWKFICSMNAFIVWTVFQLTFALISLQGLVDFSQWLEEVPVNYDVYLSKDSDPDSFRQIHLYRVL